MRGARSTCTSLRPAWHGGHRDERRRQQRAAAEAPPRPRRCVLRAPGDVAARHQRGGIALHQLRGSLPRLPARASARPQPRVVPAGQGAPVMMRTASPLARVPEKVRPRRHRADHPHGAGHEARAARRRSRPWSRGRRTAGRARARRPRRARARGGVREHDALAGGARWQGLDRRKRLGVGNHGRAPARWRHDGAAASATLLQQLDALDHQIVADALEHVVDRERSDRDRGERLHLHPGATGGAHGGADLHPARALVQLDRHRVDGQRVAQRDEARRCASRPGCRPPAPRRARRLWERVLRRARQRWRLVEANEAASYGGARSYVLARDIDHARVPARVEVGHALGPRSRPHEPATHSTSPSARVCTASTPGDPA